jgi:hypothetical protein
VTIYEDNQAAIAISKQHNLHERTKHIDIRYHWLRERVERKEIALTYIQSTDNLADTFTKPLAKILFRKLNDRLMNIQDTDVDMKGDTR